MHNSLIVRWVLIYTAVPLKKNYSPWNPLAPPLINTPIFNSIPVVEPYKFDITATINKNHFGGD